MNPFSQLIGLSLIVHLTVLLLERAVRMYRAIRVRVQAAKHI